MSIAPVGMNHLNLEAINAGLTQPSLSLSGATSDAAKTPFSDLLTESVKQVDTLEQDARSAVEGLMTGAGVDVHTAMIATQRADMAFEFALSVRNKAVQAYQQVMQMQF